jgi:hypothetical protein
MESIRPKLKDGVPIECPPRKPLPAALDRAYDKPLDVHSTTRVAQPKTEHEESLGYSSPLSDHLEARDLQEDIDMTSQEETSTRQLPQKLRRQDTTFEDFLEPSQMTTWDRETYDDKRKSQRSVSSMKSFSSTASIRTVASVKRFGKRAKDKVTKQLQTSREQALAEVLSRVTIAHVRQRESHDD